MHSIALHVFELPVRTSSQKLLLLVLVCLLVVLGQNAAPMAADFTDPQADRDALPSVPDDFEVTMFAREPLVRQPCSMAFDAQGRLYVGMGPQYRNPTPDTPGDSVVIVQDTDGDGLADSTKIFATGFNAVQGLAWRGRDLWVANAPDLTVVRDLDGDDEADEYVRVFGDLGNLEHGLHGLNWAADGKLYMSKGNSKGLTSGDRLAPRPFRDLWGVQAPAGSLDLPPAQTFTKDSYRRDFHDPADDWGLEGGILRCDDLGKNLEIVARGFRNPWDITADSGFHWLGTDNDQVSGDRVFTPFLGAHFGWNHPWSSHWTDDAHTPSAPVSGPLFEGSGTGVNYYDAPQFPDSHRKVFFVNDWLSKTTYLWRPSWDGALMRTQSGTWEPFIQGNQSLYRPTDLEVGPDGALWVLGWSSGYGAEWKDGLLTNEGRIFRVAWRDAPLARDTRRPTAPLSEWSTAELIADFDGPLPIWRTNAQEELVRRGSAIQQELISALKQPLPSTYQETWTAWTLARLDPSDNRIDQYFAEHCLETSRATLNLRIQSVRALAHRAQARETNLLHTSVLKLLNSAEPRLRFAATQAVLQTREPAALPLILERLEQESDAATFYATWQTLRALTGTADQKQLLTDERGGVRRGALLALLEDHALSPDEVADLLQKDDDATRAIAASWQSKATAGGEEIQLRGRPLQTEASNNTTANISLVRDTGGSGAATYQAAGLQAGARPYSDRDYTLIEVPTELQGHDYIQTANDQDGASGSDFLTFNALLPLRVHVALDTRHPHAPTWLRADFERTGLQIKADHWTYQLYAKDFPAGNVSLGGNTDDGVAGGKGNYLVILTPLPLPQQPVPATIDQVLALLPDADAARGEALFRHRGGVGCYKCHSLGERTNAFGPDLATIGHRAVARHIVQSMLEPSAVITEGFTQQIIETTNGTIHGGVLLEESGLSLTLGLETGETLRVAKSAIETRRSASISAMPTVAAALPAQSVADLAAFLLLQKPATNSSTQAPQDAAANWSFDLRADRLTIQHAGQPVADFVFNDEKILRPYFSNLRVADGTATGIQVTRNHPPQEGHDATDHDTMHPGVWLGFGDISGHDFWRNKGRIVHQRFIEPPTVTEDRLQSATLRFATLCQLQSADGVPVCELINRCSLTARPHGWLLDWQAEFRATSGPFTFGDQEEMGFGARLATPLIETKGGKIINSQQQTTAAGTWGQPAAWCDYSGVTDNRRAGITLMTSPKNFRPSWWHNRDYGVFVANPLGRAAMKQGEKSAVTVAAGETFQLGFGAMIHSAAADASIDPASFYRDYLAIISGGKE